MKGVMLLPVDKMIYLDIEEVSCRAEVLFYEIFLIQYSEKEEGIVSGANT